MKFYDTYTYYEYKEGTGWILKDEETWTGDGFEASTLEYAKCKAIDYMKEELLPYLEGANRIEEKAFMYNGEDTDMKIELSLEAELYKVTTTYPGADGPSTIYYDTEDKAKAYLEGCDNGEVEKLFVSGDNIRYSDGCTWNELTYGGYYDLEVREA